MSEAFPQVPTGMTYTLYCCPVCGRTITDRQPYYAAPNLNCGPHYPGDCRWVMVKVGDVPQVHCGQFV